MAAVQQELSDQRRYYMNEALNSFRGTQVPFFIDKGLYNQLAFALQTLGNEQKIQATSYIATKRHFSYLVWHSVRIHHVEFKLKPCTILSRSLKTNKSFIYKL